MLQSFLPKSTINTIRSLQKSFSFSTQVASQISDVRVVALTGGPCGGKTSALAALASRIPQISHYKVVHVPELSTLFHTAGSHYPATGTSDDQLNWDYEKLKSQLALEDAFIHIAEKSSQDTIVLCDRGALDTKLFVSEDDWVNLTSALGHTESELLQRYDAVVHLVTTAIGAETHYSDVNNAARRETLEEAAEQDYNTRKAWMKHSNFILISNKPIGSTFQQKLRRTVDAVCSLVGIRTTSDIKRQWIVKLDHFHPPPDAICFQIETDFVSFSDTDDVCVQRTSLIDTDFIEHQEETDWDTQFNKGTINYSLHDRSVEFGGAVKRSDRRLNKREWLAYRAAAETLNMTSSSGEEDTIRMKRTCFVHDENFWKLDEIVNDDPDKKAGVCLLTLDETDIDNPTDIVPPYCATHREVSLMSLRDLLEYNFK